MQKIILSLFIGLFFSGISLHTLFKGENVGLENTGDGARLWCQVGIYPKPWSNVVWSTKIQKNKCSIDKEVHDWAYPTSSIILSKFTLIINHYFSSTPQTLNIKYQGIIVSLAMGLIIASAMFLLPNIGAFLPLTLILTSLLWIDIGFLSYYNSYYSEPMAFMSSAFLSVLIGHIAYSHTTSFSMIATILVAVIAVTSKSQMIVLIAPTIFAITAAVYFHQNSLKTKYAIPVISLFLLVLVSASYLNAFGSKYKEVNLYNTIFKGILVESPNPLVSLAEMDLPVELSKYSGTGFWPDNESAKLHNSYPSFKEEASRWKSLNYLILNPGIFSSMLGKTVKAMPNFRVNYLSNYSNSEELAIKPEPMKYTLRFILQFGWIFLPLGLILLIILGLRGMVVHKDNSIKRAWLILLVYQSIAVLLSLLIIPIGDGYYELEKHTTIAAFLFAPILGGLLSYALITAYKYFFMKMLQLFKF